MSLFLSSDHHLEHNNIIEYCSRPFTSVEHMNDELVSRWNACVKSNDCVLHLGDVTLVNYNKDVLHKKRPDFVELIKSLNGVKILVPGNHDDKRMFSFYEECGWHIVRNELQPHDEKKKLYGFILDDVMYCHNYRAASLIDTDVKVVVHGHAHGTRQRVECDPRTYIDVGVDCWGLAPVEVSNMLDEQRAKLIENYVTTLCRQIVIPRGDNLGTNESEASHFHRPLAD
jgi:calcineurin-like phosphoesterase family protein